VIDDDLSITKEIYTKANKGLFLNYQHNEKQDAMTIYNQSQTFVVRFLENIRSLASWPGHLKILKGILDALLCGHVFLLACCGRSVFCQDW